MRTNRSYARSATKLVLQKAMEFFDSGDYDSDPRGMDINDFFAERDILHEQLLDDIHSIVVAHGFTVEELLAIISEWDDKVVDYLPMTDWGDEEEGDHPITSGYRHVSWYLFLLTNRK